jgi:hypothetical protein
MRMKRHVLFLITGDPRLSPRPAEAVRIAAGVAAWKQVIVAVYFRAAAVLALSEATDGLVDEENFTRYLPTVRAAGCPVFVERGAPLLAALGRPTLAFEEIDDTRLGALAAECHSVVCF